MSVISQEVVDLAVSLRTPVAVPKQAEMASLQSGLSDASNRQLTNFLLDGFGAGVGGQLDAYNRRTAMGVPAFARSVTLLSGLMSQLISGGGLHVVNIETDEKVKSPKARDMIRLLVESPDGNIPSVQFIEDLSIDYLIDGNSIVIPDKLAGRIHSLRRGYSLESRRLSADSKTLHIPTEDGLETRARRDVILSRWPVTYDITQAEPRRDFAPSNIDVLRTSLSLAVSSDQHVLEYFKALAGRRAVNFAVLIKSKLQPEQIQAAQQSLTEQIGRGGPYLFGESSIQNLNDDAQNTNMKELRELQIRQIAGHYGVPPVLVGEESTSWGTGIEELAKILVRFGVNPHMTRFLDPFSLVMLPRGQKFAVDKGELVAASIENLTKLATIALGDMQRPPFLSQTEVRDMFGKSPDPSLPSKPFMPPQPPRPPMTPTPAMPPANPSPNGDKEET